MLMMGLARATIALRGINILAKPQLPTALRIAPAN